MLGDTTLTALLSKEGSALINVKFFRGDRDLISKDEMTEQAHSALTQHKMGTATVSSTIDEGDEGVSLDEFLSRL